MTFAVRRVRRGEWARVRELRLAALADPDADIAFIADGQQHQEEKYWRDRCDSAAAGDGVAQFVVEDGESWLGSVTVLRREAGSSDHTGRIVAADRSDVVGVYVRPEARGSGAIDTLLDVAAEWAAGLGEAALVLDVHIENARAQAAYRRSGFVATGASFTGAVGPEIEMRRPLSSRIDR